MNYARVTLIDFVLMDPRCHETCIGPPPHVDTLVCEHTRQSTHRASHCSGHSGVTEMAGMAGGSRKVMEGLYGTWYSAERAGRWTEPD